MLSNANAVLSLLLLAIDEPRSRIGRRLVLQPMANPTEKAGLTV